MGVIGTIIVIGEVERSIDYNRRCLNTPSRLIRPQRRSRFGIKRIDMLIPRAKIDNPVGDGRRNGYRSLSCEFPEECACLRIEGVEIAIIVPDIHDAIGYPR